MQELKQQIQTAMQSINRLQNEMHKVVIGQGQMINRLLIGLLSNGHILLEGIPGLAKTLTIKTLAHAVDGHFSRIQFTPDLLPADVLGTMIYNQARNEFVVRKGPIFANFILADEINRAPAKVQSALLEAMQEKQVTIGDTTYRLPEPFLVLATQNPLEQEGTYPLPEAQMDRFMLKVIISYPTKAEEQIIMQQQTQQKSVPIPQKAMSLKEIVQARELVHSVYIDPKLETYILDIVFATRYPNEYNLRDIAQMISYGGSPRASINLALASKTYAFLNERPHVIPDDIKSIAKDVLRHRIGLTYEAEAEGISVENIIDMILDKIQVP